MKFVDFVATFPSSFDELNTILSSPGESTPVDGPWRDS